MDDLLDRGSGAAYALEVVEGDASAVETVTARLRLIRGQGSRPQRGEPVAAVLSVSHQAATSSEPERWLMSLSSAASATLALGRYRLDAVATIGGQHISQGGFVIEVVEPATVLE